MEPRRRRKRRKSDLVVDIEGCWRWRSCLVGDRLQVALTPPPGATGFKAARQSQNKGSEGEMGM